MKKNIKLITIVGKPGSGKTTIAKYLENQRYKVIILSNFIKEYIEKQGAKDFSRKILQTYGNQLRDKFGPQILVEKALEEIKLHKYLQVVIDGVRNLHELEYLQRQPNCISIGVVADKKIRYQRLVKKRGKKAIGSHTQFSASEYREDNLGSLCTGLRVNDCVKQADFIIHNSSTISALYKQIDEILLKSPSLIHRQKYLQIALDGGVASGKGDISKRLAQKLNLSLINTGSMYRALTLACLERSIDINNAKKVVALLKQIKIDLKEATPGNLNRVTIDGKNVSKKIYSNAVNQTVANVAKIPQVREIMVQKQKQLAQNRGVVMEGRDIGLRVLPRAQLKIFLSADLKQRAIRRQKQLLKNGKKVPLNEILRNIKDRDLQDSKRSLDPLQKLPEAWELDTSKLTLKESVDKIIAELKHRQLI